MGDKQITYEEANAEFLCGLYRKADVLKHAKGY